MALEAKDIYNANNLIKPNSIGYNCKDKKGKIVIKKFVNSLDFSLDMIKLREIYEHTYRKNDFTFNINKHDYTQSVICVKFSYAHKEFNKCGKNMYIKTGYTYNDLKFNDCVCIKNNELIGIILEKAVITPIFQDILTDNFIIEDGVYKSNKEIKTLLSKSELRDYLYNNGFYCDGVKYIRLKRSSGSSRVGKCLFIDENLYRTFHKWDMCGLDIKYGQQIDLAAFEAYISLPSSSIIDTIQIEPQNFLVIDDYESVFKDNVIGVDYNNGKLTAKEDIFEVTNSIFDGQTIMDRSLFGEKYKDKGMLLLRNRFFKSACFNGNIQQWFKDNKITDVSQLNGFTLAKNIHEIKLITTPSSIKYVKFAPLKQWFDNLDTTFGIVKYEKPTYYFDGRMVQGHYQLLNTLNLSKSDVAEIIKPNLNYISLIRQDPDVLRYHIKYPYEETDIITSLTSKNEIIFKLMGINSDFSKTKLYYNFRNDLIKSMVKNLKQGHILIDGNYSTLLGNGIEMLQHSIKKFYGESIIGVGNVFCKNFAFGKTILGSRSPHITSSNILLVNNTYNKLIDTYFNLSKEIVYINAIGENILQRLNGAD